MKLDVFNAIQNSRRPELIDTALGQFIYSDAGKQYQPVIPILPPFVRKVSNVESFAQYILEEARRRGNTTGDKITVSFSEGGARCLLADNVKVDAIEYNRTVSPQWSYLSAQLNEQFSHARLLRIFQSLRPSFIAGSYDTFMRQYRRVTFDEKTTITSQPFVEEGANAGKAGMSINIQFSREGGGNTKTTLPATLELSLQFARASKRVYTVELEIESELITRKEKAEIGFTLLWPERDNVIAKAIEDEMSDFREMVSEKLPEALIVVNF